MSGCHQLAWSHQLAWNQLEQLEWYKIRDTLFGFNGTDRDIVKALELAAICEHPDAVWLTKIFAGQLVGTREQVAQVFRESKSEDDTKAFFFADLIFCYNVHVGWATNLQSANLGDAFAQALVAASGIRYLITGAKKNLMSSLGLGLKKLMSGLAGLKNLLLKENVMVSTGLGIVIILETDAEKILK